MAVSAEHWLGIIHREYLARYVPGGGSAVKVVIADDRNLKRVEDGLADLAVQGKLLHVRIDAAPTRIHMIQNVFFAVSQHVDWGQLAQTWVEGKFKEHGYDWPKPGEEVPLLELAKHNNVAEALLSRALQGDMVGVARVFRDVCDEKLEPAEGAIHLEACYPDATFSNGFIHDVPGHRLVPSLTVQADVRV